MLHIFIVIDYKKDYKYCGESPRRFYTAETYLTIILKGKLFCYIMV